MRLCQKVEQYDFNLLPKRTKKKQKQKVLLHTQKVRVKHMQIGSNLTSKPQGFKKIGRHYTIAPKCGMN